MPGAVRRGGKTTVPILEAMGVRVQDSTRILHWLEKNRAPFALMPAEPAEREAALAVEARSTTRGSTSSGPGSSTVLNDAESVIRFWTLDATPRQARIVRRWFPVMRWVFRRKLR